LQSAVISVGTQGNQRLATFGTLFVTFEDDVTVGTLNVRSPDMQLPVYEVKEFNQRYAIITFHDNVPTGTLEVQVHS
jgi:sorbitol-specific phosphotransferase system component IIA